MLLQRESLSLVFLSKTKLVREEIAMIKHKIGDYKGVYADSRGNPGGLALSWCKTIKVISFLNLQITLMWRWRG